MFLVSGPEMVLAACKAGIIGAFPTPNARPVDVLEDWMRAITEGLATARAEDPEAVIGPWAANLVTHSSNTRLPGGHTGSLSPFAFVSAIREFFDGLIVVGGGIADGFGVAGAIAAGADLVYMGTRFVPTTESMAKPEYKQMLVDCSVDDIVVSSGITGTAASWLKPSLLVAGLDPDNLPATPPRNYDSNNSLKTRKWVDTWTGGQGIGAIKAVQSISEVVDGLEAQYRQAGARFLQKL